MENKKLFNGIKLSLLAFTAVLSVFATIITLSPNGFGNVSAGYIDPETDATVLSIKSQIENIESKLASLKSSISSTSSEISSAKASKEEIDEELTLVEQDIELCEEYIETLDNAIKQKKSDIAGLEAEIEDKYVEFESWIKLFYEMGESSLIQMIFDNDNFTDVMTTTEYIAVLMDSKNDMMSSLEEQVEVLVTEEAKIETYREEQLKTESDLVLKKQRYQELSESAAAYIEELQDDVSSYKAQLEAAKKAEEELNSSLEEELEKIAQQNAVYIGGALIWPVSSSYSRISSYYGWRDLYGTKDFHLGIDIPCPVGTEIMAANGGTVVKAEWHYSYGYYVLIDHGGGKATLYAHNSKLCVSQGDTVVKGQTIALAGNTGNSYGSHCHFEVRIDGKTTDPLEYVTQP